MQGNPSAREEKQFEAALTELIQKVQEVKVTLQNFLHKLETEYETLTWPSVLDNYTLLSGQLSSLMKLMKNEKIPALRNYVLMPFALSPDRDPELEKLTEHRVLACTLEVIPDYLRTKPEPEVEEKAKQLLNKADTMPADNVQKQLTTLNKITSNTIDIINAARMEWENESNAKTAQPQINSLAETHTLMAAITSGKNLRNRRPETPQLQTQISQPSQPQPKTGGSIGKAPSTIRTNIKAGANTHPYQRP